jgi:phytoene synthase
MQDAFAHCEALVREADKDRFLATLFAPLKYRRALFALYAFNAEIARVREAAREPMPGEIRLQWWRDAFEGVGRGDVRANPVAAALLDTVVRYRLPGVALLELIEARSFDLYDDPIATVAELEGYAQKTSSALIELAATILSEGRNPEIKELICHGGIAYAVAGLLRAFPHHAARRQLYVPLEVLDRHRARAEDVFAGMATPQLRAALSEMQDLARGHLDRVRVLKSAAPAAVAPALLPLALVRSSLARMARRRRRDPFRPDDTPAWRRQWIIWRAARKGLTTYL